MKTFRTIVSLVGELPELTEYREHQSPSIREAGIKAVTSLPESHRCRVALRAGERIVVSIWTPETPTHHNGVPMCVHALELVRSNPSQSPLQGAARVD